MKYESGRLNAKARRTRRIELVFSLRDLRAFAFKTSSVSLWSNATLSDSIPLPSKLQSALRVHERQDLRAACRVFLEDASQRTGDHRTAGLFGAADGHAGVDGLDD